MFNKTVYLLYVSMLVGCNHIKRMQPIDDHGSVVTKRSSQLVDNNNACVSKKVSQPIDDNDSLIDKKDSMIKLCNFINMVHNKPLDELKDFLTIFLFNCARKANQERKHEPEPAAQLFRRRMNAMSPNFISINITNSLIDCFLRHVDAEGKYGSKLCANTCVNAMIDTFIYSIELIMNKINNK